MSETRKLAAILVADVVGYSRLAGADEDRILARLRALRSDLIDSTIAVHHGRIVKRTSEWQPHRIPQRGRRRALRHRRAERPHRSQRLRALRDVLRPSGANAKSSRTDKFRAAQLREVQRVPILRLGDQI
jgi:hypothetical protein